jgi:hypothetical protein
MRSSCDENNIEGILFFVDFTGHKVTNISLAVKLVLISEIEYRLGSSKANVIDGS